ncbi:T9SS type A sorting domain-containing protein [Mongoliibacter sp.]|uniref:T9SS type A sorting domain-containing protein n=1 Tax=Mongoliibacter sp. TaxID=2022438 RepID=UPI0025D9BA05|nr:T9SS type A sorting domain-containing protein [Mongoliibacter sp.]
MLKFLLILVLLLTANGLKAQRIYPYFSGICQQNIECPYTQTGEGKISDGNLTTFGSGEFSGMGTAYLYVVFDSPLRSNDKIGVKLGYNNNIFFTDEFLSTINFYPLDEDGFPFYELDSDGIPIDEVIDFQSPQLELGESTFEIILDLMDFDFSEIESLYGPESVYGIEMFIDNSSGIWTDKDFKVYEFYILDASCQDYIDYIYTNELDNNGVISENIEEDKPKTLTLDPKDGFVKISFLFDSYAYVGDSIFMVFEKNGGFSLENSENYFEVFSYSDNNEQSPIQVDMDKAKLKDNGNGEFVLSFPVQESFNRVLFDLKEKIELKSLIRKSGGNPIAVSPEGFIKIDEDGKFIYREGNDPILLRPDLSNATGFQWFFDDNLENEIIDGEVDGVTYSILTDENWTLKIENLPFREEPFMVFLSATDPVSGCQIVKKIDFEVEGIILPLIQISLEGQMLSNQTALMQWIIQTEGGAALTSMRLEKAKEDLRFVPISENMEWVNDQEFAFTDKFPFRGNNFYRVSFNIKDSGEMMYSDVINVRNNESNSGKDFFVYPNPFESHLFVECDEFLSGPIYLNIYALDGRKIVTIHDAQIERLGNKLRIDLGFLQKGVYLLNIQASSSLRSFKIIKR